MKQVVICTDLKWGKKPFEDNIHYNKKILQNAYKELFITARKKGLHFFQSNYDWYDKKKQRFIKGWSYKKGWKQEKNIRADFIFDKTSYKKHFIPYKKRFTKEKMIINPYQIDKLCSDKILTYKTFPQLVPKSFIINNKKELLKSLKKIKSKQIVIKPRYGASAEGVSFYTKKQLTKNTPHINKGTIIQELKRVKRLPFLGKNDGVYDIRIVLCQGKIIDQLARVAKKGILTSNLSTGGKMIFLKKRQIPQQILKIAQRIDKRIRNINPRIYTLDFLIDQKNKPWLIEMNTRPAFFYYLQFHQKKRLHIFINSLINAIKENTKNPP